MVSYGGEECQEDEIGDAEGEARRVVEGREPQEQVIEDRGSPFDEGVGE